MIGRLAMSTQIIGILLFFPVFSSAQTSLSAPSGEVYCLQETQLPDGTIFFWDKTDPNNGLTFKSVDYNEAILHKQRDWLASNSREITQSNAAVIVFLPGQEIRDTYTPNVALADGIESTISYWVDYRGFVHSVDVLRRQLKKLDFYKGLDGFRPMTGILDRETLWSESVILNRELRYAHQKLLRACMDAAGEKTSCAAPPWPQEENLKACMDAAGEKTSCDAPPWPNSEIQLAEDAQQRAVYALSRYDGELRSVQFAAPTGRPAACDSAPRLYYDAPSGHLIGQFKNDSYLGGGPYPTTYNHDLQDGITEAVDPRAFDAVLGQKLAELESEARKRTHEATALVDTVVSMNPK